MRSPPAFCGTLQQLWTRYIEPNVPRAAVVSDFHRAVVAYVAEPDVLHLVRQVRGMERGSRYETARGVRLRATDNAPAWWVHYALFQGGRVARGAFGEVVNTMPVHLFQVAKTTPSCARDAGWHIAHLLPVKDGDTTYREWSRDGVIARFIRNIHPCNHGLVPLGEWQRWGGHPSVTAFLASRFADRYGDVWAELLRLANGTDPSSGIDPSVPVPYEYAPASGKSRGATLEATASGGADMQPGPSASYHATRLLFKRDVIEPLADDESFRIVTPDGTFGMTKAQFARVSAKVRESRSYRERGIYH